MEKLSKFIKLFNEKCEKENANFEKEFVKIKEYTGLEKDDYLFALQDVQTFKNKFLVPHYKMYNLLKKLNKEIFELKQKNLTEEEIDLEIKNLQKIKTELANSRIEIFFCNVLDSNALKPFANGVMPYGLLHVGLLLDDVCIQWGRSVLGKSIVNPSSDVIWSDYIFAIELENQPIWNLIKETFTNLKDYITNKKDYNKMGTIKALLIADTQLTIFAERGIKYNTKKNYNIVTKNCQHFAKKTIELLGLKVDTSGEVGKVLKKTKEKLNPFDFTFRGKEIKNRKDLDEYVLINDFSQFSKEERRVLFCYRNVYDFYARFKPNDDKYKSSQEALTFWNELAEKEKFD
jgi:hypothetical protein